MIPSIVASEVAKGIKEYIKDEFPVATPFFWNNEQSIVEEFLERKDENGESNSLVKGPWAEIKLPFRKASSTDELPFTYLKDIPEVSGQIPYLHQLEAFNRLNYTDPKSTIIATGTGSGKTECFLYPILEYCLSCTDKKGIKAIIIYPMNALASDQSRRLAELITSIKKHTGKQITAGIYTGDNATEHKDITDDHLISDRKALRQAPPDILLTNYKMLDFLLIRPEDQDLWANNGPDVCKYLVVDELHSFDGAQGTDLSCLIRRLKDRLNLGNNLACVGTSATIGGENSLAELCEYASAVFASDFSAEAGSVITEKRLNADEFLDSFDYEPQGTWPTEHILEADKSNLCSYIKDITTDNWFPSDDFGFISEAKEPSIDACIKLGTALPNLAGFRRLIKDVSGVFSTDELAEDWYEKDVGDVKTHSNNAQEGKQLARELIESLLAMISVARSDTTGSRKLPFLNVRCQLWIRSLVNVVASVENESKLYLAADIRNISDPLCLPLISCNTCDQNMWGAVIKGELNAADAKVSSDLREFYDRWFRGEPDVYLLIPIKNKDDFQRLASQHRNEMFAVCSHCKKLIALNNDEIIDGCFNHDISCSGCHAKDFVPVWIPKQLKQIRKEDRILTRRDEQCPHCGSYSCLRIVGCRSTTLSSVTTDILNGSKFNDDHKVIAFSDSVQDAALRSGFISARNYGGLVKRAISVFLKNKISNPRRPYQLTSAISEFTDYWKVKFENNYSSTEEKEWLAKADFVSTFIPSDMQWWRTWKKFREISLDPKESLLNHLMSDLKNDFNSLYNAVRQRLIYEMMIELSMNSEKVHSLKNHKLVSIGFNLKSTDNAVKELIPKIQEEFGINVEASDLNRFVLGVLQKILSIGGLDPSNLNQTKYKADIIERIFGGYLRTGNLWATFNRSSLPFYWEKKRPPVGVLLTIFNRTNDDFCEAVKLNINRKTWYEEWLKKCINSDTVNTVDFYRFVFNSLRDNKLLSSIKRDSGHEVWLLPIESLYLTNNVKTIKCSHCGRTYNLPETTAELLSGSPCMTENCDGKLQRIISLEMEDPFTLYDSDPCRINSAEHTALIDGDTRKSVETSFGKENNTWSVNFLSATPTLEMGIDIGSLSTVMLCNVPPSQANFIQRIGRAGRRDGNSLGITMVERSTHDQYFWAAPEEMIKGDVKTPGVFLKAVSVLERQLFAYAFGRWCYETNQNKKLPKLSTLLSNLKHRENNDDKFPISFINWLKNNSDSVYRSFVSLIDPDDEREPYLDSEKREYLRNYVLGDNKELSAIRKSLAVKLIELFDTTIKIKDSWDKLKADLNKRIKALEQQPQDEATKNEIENLTQERDAMVQMLKASFVDKNLFNWFAENGLLPNYAFPEESVNVNSVVIKRREHLENREDSSINSDKKDKNDNVSKFSFSRSAAQSLKALSPNSIFYANGYKLHIDRVLLQKDNNSGASYLEEWRLCPECAYVEKVDRTRPVEDNCPHCGCERWGDSGQIKNLIRIRELVAHADSRKDQIRDDSETRDQVYQYTQLFINALPDDVINAWRIDDDKFSFGFEFLKNVNIKEINFGPANETGHSIKVAGDEISAPGFKICKCCGSVYKRYRDKKEHQHSFGCKYYDKEQTPLFNEVNDNPWLDGLFLYREVNSEAIRIRLPVCKIIDAENAETVTHSLIAAFYLGLEKHFKGNVSHLKISVQTEPSREISHDRNVYLVIYDTIPGGSGYLKDLMRADEHEHQYANMIKLFKETLEALSGCSCKDDPNRDGCYRCVFHYGDSGNRRYISRRYAEILMNKILHFAQDKLVEIENLSKLPAGIESAMEERFFNRLKSLKDCSFRYSPTIENINTYLLEVPLSDEARDSLSRVFKRKFTDKFLWKVELQRDFNGVYESRPDVTISPELSQLLSIRPDFKMCIFNDGWEFHANTMSEDTLKRQSILNTGARVWSLSWDDVTSDRNTDQTLVSKYSFVSELANNKGKNQAEDIIKKILPDNLQYSREQIDSILNENVNGFDLLEMWLRNPVGTVNKLRVINKYCPLTWNRMSEEDVKSSVPEFLSEEVKPKDFLWLKGINSDPAYKIFYRTKSKKPFDVTSILVIDDSLYADKECLIHENLRKQWRKILQFANILQYSERFWWLTKDNRFENFCYDDSITIPEFDVRDTSLDDMLIADDGWADIMNEIQDSTPDLDSLKPICEELKRDKVPAPIESFIDGFGGKVLCNSIGFKWNTDNGDIFLFVLDDLDNAYEEFVKQRATVKEKEISAYAVGFDENWKKDLYEALGVAND